MVKKKKIFSVISTGSWVPSDLKDSVSKAKTYKILIDNLIVNAFIGIHEHEKNKKQRISISIIMETFDNLSKVNDCIDNVVSYELIVVEIKKLFRKGHIGLLETLGEKIVAICFKDSRILSVRLNLKKLEVFKETRSVGIEIYRENNTTGSKLSNSSKITKLKE